MHLPWWLPLGNVPEVSAQALSERLARGEEIQLVDVRTEAEFEGGHIAGAVNVPIVGFKGRLEEVPLQRDKPVVAICRSARRSIPAVRLLRRLGYTDAVQLEGGMLAWWAENAEDLSPKAAP